MKKITLGMLTVAALLVAGCQTATYTDGPRKITTTTPCFMQNNFTATLEMSSPSNSTKITVERKVSTQTEQMKEVFIEGAKLGRSALLK